MTKTANFVFPLPFVAISIGLSLIPKINAQESESALESDRPRIVLLAGNRSHGYGAHEHLAGCRLLADALEISTDKRVICEVHAGGWPSDDRVLDGAKTIVMYCDGGGGHPALGHLPRLGELMDQGVGFVCLHYAVEVPQDRAGKEFLSWLGGYFETNWSVNPHWEADFKTLPDHPIVRGVKPFKVLDEWYFHMRFVPEMEGVTPILSAIAPPETMERRDGPHSGNPHVRRAVANREPQHVAWAYQRPNGGRSFGFTGGHFHWNWGREELLRTVTNAILWTAEVEIPQEGFPLKRPGMDRLITGQDFDPPENFDADRIRVRFQIETPQ